MSEENNAVEAAESSPEQSAQEVINSIGDGEEELAEESEELEASAEVEEGEEVEDASDEELEEVLESDESSAEEKLEARQELKKRLTLKVNGQEFEEEIDFSDDDKLRELLQRGYAADGKFQEAAAIKKQVEQFVSALQGDPFGALRELGYDVDDLTDNYMKQRIADLEKSPEQLKIEELQRELESERKAKDEREKARQDAEIREAEENFSRQLDNDITSALSESDLPKSPYVAKRIADNLITAFELGYEDVSVAEIMPVVEDQIKGEIREMFEAMPEEVIEQLLGNEVSTKLRKRRIKKAKKVPTTASSIKSTGKSEMKAVNDAKEPDSPKKAEDFFKNIGSY